jgi:hypothetical protein
VPGEVRIFQDPFPPGSPVSGTSQAPQVEILKAFLGGNVFFIQMNRPQERSAGLGCGAVSGLSVAFSCPSGGEGVDVGRGDRAATAQKGGEDQEENSDSRGAPRSVEVGEKSFHDPS